MATLEQLAFYSQTAQAAYATGLIPNVSNILAYEGEPEMSASQASQFDATWNVLQQSDLDGDGFSAVLFQNRITGEKVLAIRGTEATVSDWFIDLRDIALAGHIGGMPQYTSLEDFYQELLNQGLLTSTEQITVTGHSLGGFLAQAFTANHDTVVSAAYTYNAPGFYGAQTQLLEWLGISSATAPNVKITNAYAMNGLSMTAGLGTMVGTLQGVQIERDAIPTGNHSIIRLGDSLAVQGMLAQLDANFSQNTANSLTQAASNQIDNTVESMLDAVRRRLLGTAATTTQTGDRDALYTNLQTLTDSAAFATLLGKLHAGPVSSVLATQATTEFSALLALQTLSPVVLRGSDVYNQALLDTTLGGVNSDLYALWQADQALTAEERAAGKANFSTEWLSDRAAMHNIIAQRNIADSSDPLDARLSEGVARTYIDMDTSTQVETGSGSVRMKVVFGGDAGNILSGGELADRLYGGAGIDTLYGDDGDDYLEGRGGDDVLTSGDGRDTLNGGAGLDEYIISAGEQSATIRDSDGAGAIVIERADLTSYTLGNNIREIAGSVGHYEDDDGNRYQFYGSDLLIQIKDGARTITIENFDSMSGTKLGLNLQGPESYTPPTGVPTYTVGAPNQNITQDLASENALGSYQYNGGWMSGGARFHRSETEVINASAAIEDAANHQYWVSWVNGGMGDSTITGDAGVNLIRDDSEAYLDGEPGILAGVYGMSSQMGNDRIDAGAGDDWVLTSGGDDTVYGGAGNEELFAGAGSGNSISVFRYAA